MKQNTNMQHAAATACLMLVNTAPTCNMLLQWFRWCY